MTLLFSIKVSAQSQNMDFTKSKIAEKEREKSKSLDVFGAMNLWSDSYKIEFLSKAKTSAYAAANGVGTHVFGKISEPKCSVWYDSEMIRKQPRLFSIEKQFVEALGEPNAQQLILLHEVGHCVISFSALPSLDLELKNIWGNRQKQELFADIYSMYSYMFLYESSDESLFNLIKSNIEQMRRSETVEYYENAYFIKKISFKKAKSLNEVCENTWEELGEILNKKIKKNQLRCNSN